MKTPSTIRLGVVSSIAVAIVIASVAFSILRGMNAEVRRMEALSEIADTARAVHILTASFKEESVRSDIRQVKGMLLSLGGLLKNMSARTQREGVLIEQLRKSYTEPGPLIDQWFASGRATRGIEEKRRDILASQIWMKAQFISDDTRRLKNISHSRIIAAQQRTVVAVVVLIVILAGANGVIYVLSVRSVIQAQRALREGEQRLRLAQGIARVGTFDWNISTGVNIWTPELEAMYGLPPGGFAKTQPAWESLVHPEDRAQAVRKVEYAFETGLPAEAEWRVVWPDGSVHWLAGRWQVFKDASGQSVRMTGVNIDITKRKQAEETISHQAHHDLLTGLANRVLFTDHLAFALSQAHRNHTQVAVLFMDLDRFKTVNDTLGHTVGDDLLKETARRITPCLRETDTVARIGGDEFTVLLSQVAHLEDISRITDKIMTVFEHPFAFGEHTFHMTASIGISVYPGDGTDADTLIKHADIAMYHAKGMGRNNYQFYSPALNIRTLERMILENSLRRTLERGELELFYQPQFDIATGRMVCAEALIRWRHPELGVLNPMQFIPLAEETGFIVSIDEWVLRTACSQNKAWQDAGYPPLCVTVNLSSRRFKQPGLADTVARILDETGLAPRWLELEVTEAIAMEDIEHTIPHMRELAEAGVDFSIDDFGTGYSSLSHLKKLPVKKLKIDKSFIRDIATDTDDRAIVTAIVSMAHNMGLKVVAEGVETLEQLLLLRAHSCDEAQGFFGSHPLTVEKYERFVKTDGQLPVA